MLKCHLASSTRGRALLATPFPCSEHRCRSVSVLKDLQIKSCPVEPPWKQPWAALNPTHALCCIYTPVMKFNLYSRSFERLIIHNNKIEQPQQSTIYPKLLKTHKSFICEIFHFSFWIVVDCDFLKPWENRSTSEVDSCKDKTPSNHANQVSVWFYQLLPWS